MILIRNTVFLSLRNGALACLLASVSANAWAQDAPVVQGAAPTIRQAADAGEIARLMELFYVRQIVAKSRDLLISDPSMQRLPDSVRNCLSGEITEDVLFDAMRWQYEQVFADPAIRRDSLKFFETEVGRKMIRTMLVPVLEIDSLQAASRMDADNSARDTINQMSEAEMKEITRFSRTPAGAAFRDIPKRLAAARDESERKLFASVARKCGLVPKASANAPAN